VAKKDNPDSGQVWNLILDVFRGEAAHTCNYPRNFCSEYILWRQWTAAAAEQRPDTATAAFDAAASSFQTSTDCWPS